MGGGGGGGGGGGVLPGRAALAYLSALAVVGAPPLPPGPGPPPRAPAARGPRPPLMRTRAFPMLLCVVDPSVSVPRVSLGKERIQSVRELISPKKKGNLYCVRRPY